MTNLNALIRYKQIDLCLKNPFMECTIEKLRENCTQALGEYRGVYKLVSERTIREDIRVMRSEILGFNAPIKFENGKYFYTDKEYSIFKVPMSDIQLLKDVYNFLIVEKYTRKDVEFEILLKRIAAIIGEKYPPVLHFLREDVAELFGKDVLRSPQEEICFDLNDSSEFLENDELMTNQITWGVILQLFN